MAHVQNHKSIRETTRHRPNNSSKVHRSEGINKQKWVSEHKLVHGSLQEGHGFAIKRKEKIKHEYNKLLRKQWKSKGQKSDLKDKYPDHLQHLYLAEEQRQRDEELKKRHRLTERTASTGKEVEEDSHEDRPGEVRINTVAQPGDSSGQTLTLASPVSSPQSNSRKTRRKMTSYNRTKEDYKKQREDHERKKEAYLKYTADREEAIRKYKEKKKATYDLLKKKTKKGQPNLNAQMELLLQKIQCSKQ